VSVLHAIRPRIPLAVLGLVAALTVVACSSSPSAQARACTARSHLQASLDQLRNFDYTNGTASALADDLDSARKGLIGIEAAVHLPQNTGLQQLGGVARIRQLEAEARSLASSVQAAGTQKLDSFENAVRQRTTEMQQVAGAVTGC
jgi:hypothetical protein